MEKTAAPQVYGADEISAVVLDPGSYTTQLGYAGYDHPSLVLPSYYGHNAATDNKVFDENLLFSNSVPDVTVRRIIENNLVVDWDGAMAQYDYMAQHLEINPAEQPLLLTESTMNSYKNKVSAMEMFFERESFCAFYAVKQPTAISFAHGRPNCLVVDIGHDLTTVTPIIDGLCLRNQVRGTRYAGAFVNAQMKALLANKGIQYVAPFQVRDKTATYWESDESKPVFTMKDSVASVSPSLVDFSYLRSLREMKELLLECCMDDETTTATTLSKEELDADSTRWFELPNAQNVPFTLYEREKLANSLFNPQDTITGSVVQGWESPESGDIIKTIGTEKDLTSKDYVPLRRSKKADGEDGEDDDAVAAKDAADSTPAPATMTSDTTTAAASSNTANDTNGPAGVVKLIQSVLDNLDIDLKPQLANNIVITGATSLIPRLTERINAELVLLNPSLKIRIHASGNTIERKHSSWIGGSILASLGTFHQLWVSRTEYEEVGADQLIVNRFR
jgi:actin-related protein 4